MKALYKLSLFLLFLTACKARTKELTSKVTVDNSQVKVTEYLGDPTGDVCGHGLHQHGPHLTILLTDGDVVETKDGKSQKMHAYKGLCFWSEGATHSCINIGSGPIRSIIVEVKNPTAAGSLQTALIAASGYLGGQVTYRP